MEFLRAMERSLFSEEEGAGKVKRTLKAAFVLYLLVLAKVIVFKYPFWQLRQITASWTRAVILEGLDTANFTLFRTIKMYIRYWGRLNSFENLFGNILAFVPFGFLLPFLHRESRHWWVLLINAFVLVCGIELFQLVTAYGAFDVDDILLNCFGAMLGYGLFALFWYRGYQKRKRK